MAQTAVRDVVIWAKHIHGNGEVAAHVAALKGGETIELLVDGVKGTWRKMDDGRDGRPTSGIRPIGRMQDFWRELYAGRRGDVVPVELPKSGGGAVSNRAGARSAIVFPPLARNEEERQAALEALIGMADQGYADSGLTLTRDDLHDRGLDREGL